MLKMPLTLAVVLPPINLGPQGRPFSLAEYRDLASGASLFSELSARTFLAASVAAGGPAVSDPSARTSADQRLRLSVSVVPGTISPISTRDPKATRGALRLATAVSIASAASGVTAPIRSSAPAA